jgi:hypothetical protein
MDARTQQKSTAGDPRRAVRATPAEATGALRSYPLQGSVPAPGDRFPSRPLTAHDVLHLQRTVGNQAVGRLLSRAGTPRTVKSSAGRAVIQRLRKGDFKDLATLGLDVGTWIEFAEVVHTLSYSATLLALSFLGSRKEADLDTTRARMLIEKRKHRLRKPSPSGILDLYFGKDPHPGPQAVVPRTRQVVVGDGVADTAILRTASDLLVWLVSHPTASAKSPRAYAETEILAEVLDALWKLGRTVDPPEVWDALRAVVASRAPQEDDDGQDRDVVSVDQADAVDHAEAEPEAWEAGEWDDVDDAQWIPLRQPARFVRQVPEEKYAAALQAIAARVSGHKLVGLHATRIESTATLVAEGVSEARFDSGHGVGKGKGFYIVPTTGAVNRSIRETVASWGTHAVAVYVPKECQMLRALGGDTVQTLEAENEGGCFYYQFGAAEAVIPPSVCGRVILVTDPADISTADPWHPAVRDTSAPLDFLAKLPR